MGKHLSLYRSILEYNNDTNREIPNVSYIEEENGNNSFYYQAKENSQFPEFPNYPGAPVNGKNYLRFRAVTDSTISMKQRGNSNTVDIKYSYDGQNWIQWDYLNDTISLSKGTVVYMKGDNSSGFNKSNSEYKYFSMTGKIAAGGNIMSILYDDDFEDKYTIPCSYCYNSMFWNYSSLNSSLTTAPELPATTLAPYCYNNMFSGCTELTTAPELPATTLAEGCYSGIFSGCKSLTTAPALPVTTLAKSCYWYMFEGCKSLTTAPKLPATTLTQSCYTGMFSSCTSLTTAPELPATTLANGCYLEMFYNCTSLTTAPELLATTLDAHCYESMFSACTSLNHIKMLATDISAFQGCLDGWVYKVANNGTFIKHPNMNSLPTGMSGIPSGWTVQDASI